MGVVINKVVEGNLIDVSSLPDKVFAEKMLGDSIAYKPKNGLIYSPVDGEVTMIFPTGHAVGIKMDDGMEVLIHVGINSVNLKGKGFITFVKDGDKVKKGDRLLGFDLKVLSDNNINDSVIVILTNGGVFKTDLLKRVKICHE